MSKSFSTASIYGVRIEGGGGGGDSKRGGVDHYGIGWWRAGAARWMAVRTSSGVSARVKMVISSGLTLPRSTAVWVSHSSRPCQ